MDNFQFNRFGNLPLQCRNGHATWLDSRMGAGRLAWGKVEIAREVQAAIERYTKVTEIVSNRRVEGQPQIEHPHSLYQNNPNAEWPQDLGQFLGALFSYGYGKRLWSLCSVDVWICMLDP